MAIENIIPDDAPPLVNVGRVAHWLGVHKTTILLWVKKGILPQPIHLTERVVLYDTQAIREFVKSRIPKHASGKQTA